MTTLVPGLLVGKNVRLVRQLAQGGMGSVWVADHLGLGTQVAVKFMTAEVAQNAQSVQRFTSEATAAARIKSPHVVQVFDHGIADFGMPYIVMELLEGEDLAKRVERLGPLSLPETVKIIGQACLALSKAHAIGIVHRDIKPENIFLTDSGGEVFVKVLDFGIAKQGGEVAHGVTATGMIVGTPSYMSPEQVLSAKHLDHRSDIWSLGVVAYHCLTAQVPFHGESFGALAVAIHASVFNPPSSLRGNLPPGVDAWFARAMARAPEERFGSAREMADALAAVTTWGDRAPLPSHPGSMPSSAMGGPPAQGFPAQGYPGAPSVSTLSSNAQRGSGPAPTFDGAAFTQSGGQRRTGLVALLLVALVFAALGAGGLVIFMRSRAKPEPVAAATTAAAAPVAPTAVASATNAPTADTGAAPPSVTPVAAATTPAESAKKLGPPAHGGRAPAPAPTRTAAPAAAPPSPPPSPPPPKVLDRGF